MKFRIRDGFQAFNSHDAAITFEAAGPKSGVKPINAGRVLNLTPAQASEFLVRGQLGALEPVDDEARRFYGNTPPLVSTVFSHPERHAIRQEPPRSEFRLEGAL